MWKCLVGCLNNISVQLIVPEILLNPIALLFYDFHWPWKHLGKFSKGYSILYRKTTHTKFRDVSEGERERWADAFLSQQIAVAPHLQVTIGMGSKGSLTLLLRVWINIKSILEQENTLHYVVKWILSHWKNTLQR